MRGPSLIFIILLLGCSANHEELTGIRWDDWKDDRNGCMGKRATYLDSLDNQKDKLKARSEMDIVKLMGRPDETELYKRNQKFYTYYILSGPGCEHHDPESKKLVIRFNAMGLAKEVALE
jgi:hypothetical protein